MTGTLRDRLAAVLGPGNDDTTAYAQADAVLEVLALETQRNGICGATPPQPIVINGIEMPTLCDLSAGHLGMHETDRIAGGRGYWPQQPTWPTARQELRELLWSDDGIRHAYPSSGDRHALADRILAALTAHAGDLA